jgi:hypothetical protein
VRRQLLWPEVDFGQAGITMSDQRSLCKAESIYYEIESWSFTYQCQVDVVCAVDDGKLDIPA